MNRFEPLRAMPTVGNHTYWHRKKQFLLAEDRYPEWVAIAVEEGAFAYEIGQERGTASFGDLVLCPPHTPFRRTVLSELSFHFFLFHWEDVSGNPIDAIDGHFPALPVKIGIRDTDRLRSDYSYLKTASDAADMPDRKNFFFNDIWALYALEMESKAAASGKQEKENPLMDKAAAYIRQHAFEKISLKQLASSLGLSPVQFSRNFQSCFHLKPMDFLTDVRLQQAQNLLLETGLTIEQIAERCGYDNGFYLSRVFSRKIKMSPSRFRRTQRI